MVNVIKYAFYTAFSAEIVYPRDLSNFFKMSNDEHIYKAIKRNTNSRNDSNETSSM